MNVKFNSHTDLETGAMYHSLEFPVGTPEAAAKKAVANADPKMWDHLYEIRRTQNGGRVLVEYEYRVTP